MRQCYFLVAEQESNQRSRHRGGATKMRPPLCTPPAAAPTGVQKCPDFWTPATQKLTGSLRVDARKSAHFRVSDGDAAGGVHREGRIFVAPPLCRVLWLLSWRDKKVTLLQHCLQQGIPICRQYVVTVENDKVDKKKGAKLLLSTIARICIVWYHRHIQVDSAYSTK